MRNKGQLTYSIINVVNLAGSGKKADKKHRYNSYKKRIDKKKPAKQLKWIPNRVYQTLWL